MNVCHLPTLFSKRTLTGALAVNCPCTRDIFSKDQVTQLCYIMEFGIAKTACRHIHMRNGIMKTAILCIAFR